MSSMKAVYFLAVATSFIHGSLSAECPFAGFYRELGCSPDISDNSTDCPKSFNCPDLHPDMTKCYYKGVAYEPGTSLPESVVKSSCAMHCSCSISPKPSYSCDEVDCVEDMDRDTAKDCIRTSKLEGCCSSGWVCGKDEIAKLKTCEVDGQIYREGQLFKPKNTTKYCACTATWNGEIEGVDYCKDLECGLEIHHQDDITDKCAPVFYGNTFSCPLAYECPTALSKVIPGANAKEEGSKSKAKCLFGNLTMNIGDEVTVEDKCTKCKCDVAPIVTCVKTYC